MAVLQKIRERTVLVLVMIGLGMFGFLFMGSDQSSMFSCNGQQENIIGSVNGEEIDQKEFSAYLDSIKSEHPNRSEEEYIKYAWESLVNEKLIASSASNLGLSVTDEELKELETDSFNVSPYFKNLFEEQFIKDKYQFDEFKKQNPDDTTTLWQILNILSEYRAFPYDNLFVDINGNFSGEEVEILLQNREQWDEEAEKKWSQLEDQISKQRLSQKYQTLIEKGMYTTKSELNERVWNADVKYVSIDYARLEEVEVTEEEISEYYNSNINLYQNEEETRNVEYVAFTVVPSKEDRETIQQDMILEGNKKSQDFVKNKDVDTDIYKKAEDIIDPNFTKLITNEEGVEAVEGPYELPNGSYRLAKLIKIENRPDSVKASHILLQPKLADTLKEINDKGDTIITIIPSITINDCKLLAKDLQKQYDDGADFGQLAVQYSKDKQSSIKGGDLGWLTEGMRPPEFNDVCFTSQIGVPDTVTTQDGVHLIKIDAVSDSTPEKYQIAYIDKEIVASKDTRDDYEWKAKTFLDLAKSQGLTQEASEPKNKFLQYWWLFLDIGIIFILFYLYKKEGHESRYKRLMPYIGLFAILVTTIYGVYFNSTTEDDTTQLITDNKFHELYLSDSTGGEKNEANDISKMQSTIKGLTNSEDSREIVKWLFDEKTKVGDVSNPSKPYECGDKFVVVSLSAINPKGNKTLKSVRDDIIGEIQTNKKFDAISSQLSGSPTLEEAASLFNTTVSNASDVNFESKTINNTITESLDVQNFVGAVNALDSEQTSLLIKGKNSAYVIKVISKGSGTEYIPDANSSVFYDAALKVLKDNSDIIDNRIDFY